MIAQAKKEMTEKAAAGLEQHGDDDDHHHDDDDDTTILSPSTDKSSQTDWEQRTVATQAKGPKLKDQCNLHRKNIFICKCLSIFIFIVNICRLCQFCVLLIFCLRCGLWFSISSILWDTDISTTSARPKDTMRPSIICGRWRRRRRGKGGCWQSWQVTRHDTQKSTRVSLQLIVEIHWNFTHYLHYIFSYNHITMVLPLFRINRLNKKKYLVCEDELFELLRVCQYCAGKADINTKEIKGTFLKVQQVRLQEGIKEMNCSLFLQMTVESNA